MVILPPSPPQNEPVKSPPRLSLILRNKYSNYKIHLPVSVSRPRILIQDRKRKENSLWYPVNKVFRTQRFQGDMKSKRYKQYWLIWLNNFKKCVKSWKPYECSCRLLEKLYCSRKLPEAIVLRWSVKIVFLKISEISQESTCARVSFLIKLQVWDLLRPPEASSGFLWASFDLKMFLKKNRIYHIFVYIDSIFTLYFLLHLFPLFLYVSVERMYVVILMCKWL